MSTTPACSTRGCRNQKICNKRYTVLSKIRTCCSEIRRMVTKFNFLILKKYWYSKNKFLSLALAVWGRGMLSRCSITSLANPFFIYNLHSSLSHVLIVNQNYFKRCPNELGQISGYTTFYYVRIILENSFVT